MILRDVGRQLDIPLCQVHHTCLQTTNLHRSYERGVHQLADDKVLRIVFLEVLAYLLTPVLGNEYARLCFLALGLNLFKGIFLAIAFLYCPREQGSTLFEVIVIGAVADCSVLMFPRLAILAGIVTLKNIVHILHSHPPRKLIATQVRVVCGNPLLETIAETLVTAHSVFRQFPLFILHNLLYHVSYHDRAVIPGLLHLR